MKYLIYSFILGLALIVQLTLGDLLAIQTIRPDLLLIALVYISMREGRRYGAIWGFLAGLAEDILLGGLLGARTLARSVSCFLAGTLMFNRSFRHSYEASFTVAILAFVNNLILYGLVTTGQSGFLQGSLAFVLFPALYTEILALIIFAFIPESTWEQMYRARPKPLGANE
jgi:rod shape-determining protein MreD